MPLRWWPQIIAAGITVPFAIWVATSEIRGVLHPAAWLLPLGSAYFLGLRIGREVVRGVRRARGDEAVPPDADEAGERKPFAANSHSEET